MIANINKSITPKPSQTWDEIIAPQVAQVNARKAEEARIAEEARAQAQATAQVTIFRAPQSGTCGDWMNAAGISDQASAYALIMRESGCNPNAVNASSGACGIGQQLPCGKWPHVWNDPIGAMIDMQAYVYGRYGSWANALAHSYAYNWY